MKEYTFSVLLILSHFSWSQNVNKRIDRVENGLTFPKTLAVGTEIIKSNFNQQLQENNIPGASVAVVSDGKIEWLKAYGVANIGRSDSVTTMTLFQCASIGKPITALAALKLVEAGKIDLDENINNKLKRWKVKENENTQGKKVTLRHLLSHSAGLTDGYGFPGYDPTADIPTLVQILNNDPVANTNKKLDIKKQPGTVEKYSGAGYLIIQLVIEDVSEDSFDDFVKQHIFDPLNMSYTTYDYQPDKNFGLSVAAGHRSNGKSLKKKKKYNIYPEKGAAGPWTTAEDLAKLIIGIQDALAGKNNAVLNQKLTKEFLTAQINNKGLGVNLKGVDKPEAFWHAGQNLGYTALWYGLTEKSDGAVILLNSDGGEGLMQEFMTSVAMEYDWPVLKTYKSLEIPQDLQSSLVGSYCNSDDSKSLFITQKSNQLFLSPIASKKGYQLYRINENRYTLKDSQDYYKLSLKVNSNGIILNYLQSVGKTMEFKKTE